LKTDNGYEIKNYLKTDIEFIEQDIRHQCPEGIFDLILCRNLAFTYFEEDLQRAIIGEVVEKLGSNGFFIVGSQESIPSGIQHLSPYWKRSIYRKIE
jgi:chemotaxis protein methyltransferase CheR